MKTKLRYFSLIVIVAFFSSNIFAQEKKLPAQKFLNMAQHPPGAKTWAQLEGTTTHKRKGKPIRKSPIYLGIRFTPEQTFAQVTIGKDEIYRIGQSYYAKKEKVTVIREGGDEKAPSILADFGIKPDDLTMSFLFWKLKEELPAESVKAQNCRVFLLKSPDNNEIAKTFISSKYLFPLKVEWTRIKEKEPYRMMEITSFKKVNDLWLIDAVMMSGPGWRTKVEFSKCNAGMVEKGTPKDLFRDIKTGL